MGNSKQAEEAVSKVVQNQNEDGSFTKAETSITRSSGKSLSVETSSLALLSMLRVDSSKWTGQIQKTVGFLIASMNGGYFGSTQATILAMKALVEFMNISNQSDKVQFFDVSVNSNKYLMSVGDQMKHPGKSRSRISIECYKYILCNLKNSTWFL